MALAVLLGMAMVPGAADANGGKPPAMQVIVDPVRTELLAQTVRVIGRLVPRRSGEVAARTGGPIAAFKVDVGDVVQEGDVIATLDAQTLEAEVSLLEAETRQHAAQVRTAEGRVSLLKQELDRITRLKASAAFSQASLDDKQQEVAIAEGELAEQRAALQVARANQRLAVIQLERADIRAPYAGVVTQRHTETGAYVSPGDAMISMIAPDTLEIEADVPVQRIAGLQPGTDISFVLADGESRDAFVRAVVPDENPLTRTRRVRFTAELPIGGPSTLAANQSATVHLPLGERRDILSVHKDAVLNRGGKTLVYVVSDENTADLREVSLDEAVGQRFVVIAGLEDGDQVVIRGNERLRPGQAIAPRSADGS